MYKFLMVAFGLMVTNFCFAKDLPVEKYAKLPAFQNPKLSPNGKELAVSMTIKGEKALAMLTLAEEGTVFKNVKPVPSGKLFFHDYRWASDDRLLVDVRTSVQWFNHLANVTRTGIMDRSATDFRYIKSDRNNWGVPAQYTRFVNLLRNDDEHVLMVVDHDKTSISYSPEVDKINIYTGNKKRVQKNIKAIHYWIADEDGQIRIGVAYKNLKRKTDVITYYRKTEGHPWEKLQAMKYFDNDLFKPIRFHENDPNILLVKSDTLEEGVEEGDQDTWVLFKYDLESREITGIYKNEKEEKILSDFRGVADDYKVRIASKNPDRTHYIIELYNDTKPPRFILFNTEDKTSKFLSSNYPELEGHTFSPMETVQYKARDGLTIPAYLTVPHDTDGKNLPTVILPHGGPWARDYWGFDRLVQFLADRGYAVLQPQFRGSTGFGIEHEEAGYKEWGYAIQDDITDGVKWLIDRGVADPKRICILGASFGGYAASVGLAKTPELYKCGVAIAGVHDLKQFIRDGSHLLFSGVNREIWNEQKNAENASPYHLANNIQAPLLLMHGTKDTVVPIKHSTKLYKKLKKLKRPVELVKLKGGEHWRTNEEHELIKLQAIEKFLATHLQ